MPMQREERKKRARQNEKRKNSTISPRRGKHISAIGKRRRNRDHPAKKESFLFGNDNKSAKNLKREKKAHKSTPYRKYRKQVGGAQILQEGVKNGARLAIRLLTI